MRMSSITRHNGSIFKMTGFGLFPQTPNLRSSIGKEGKGNFRERERTRYMVLLERMIEGQKMCLEKTR